MRTDGECVVTTKTAGWPTFGGARSRECASPESATICCHLQLPVGIANESEQKMYNMVNKLIIYIIFFTNFHHHFFLNF